MPTDDQTKKVPEPKFSPKKHFDFNALLKIKTSTLPQKRFVSTAKKGECLFTWKDAMSSRNPLSRIFRLICIKLHITEEYLFDKHKEYLRGFGSLPTAINTEKHNLRKALDKDTMTVYILSKFLDILGLSVVDIVYVIRDNKTGEIQEYKYSDTEKYAEEHKNETPTLLTDMGQNTRDSSGGIHELKSKLLNK